MILNGLKLLQAAPIKNMISFKDTFGGASYGLTEAGYDIRLKQTVIFSNGSIHKGDNDQIYNREDGKFTLASAIEEFDMPSNLVAVVHDKSTWARQGLSVFNTVIEPGWKGFLTLELVYHGFSDLLLPAGTGIAQILFHETSEDRSYGGKYQNQADEPTPAKFK